MLLSRLHSLLFSQKCSPQLPLNAGSAVRLKDGGGGAEQGMAEQWEGGGGHGQGVHAPSGDHLHESEGPREVVTAVPVVAPTQITATVTATATTTIAVTATAAAAATATAATADSVLFVSLVRHHRRQRCPS